MRLKRYIIESNLDIPEEYDRASDKFIEMVRRNCKPYLKLLKGRNPILRGMEPDKSFIVWSADEHFLEAGAYKVRKDRRSLGGWKPELMKMMNEWFEKKGAARRDRSVIGISKQGDHPISLFGDPHWIWPIGNFKYTFVRSKDFNDSNRSGWTPQKFLAYIEWHQDKGDEMEWETSRPGPGSEQIVTKTKYRPLDAFGINTKFDEAYKNGYEIWFECDKYYYVKIQNQFTPMGFAIQQKMGLKPL